MSNGNRPRTDEDTQTDDPKQPLGYAQWREERNGRKQNRVPLPTPPGMPGKYKQRPEAEDPRKDEADHA